MRCLIAFLIAAMPLAAQTPALTPSDIAALVDEADAAKLPEPLTAALASPEALVRATAARVAAVRNAAAVLPALRERLASESDPNAAREEVRALVILGEPADVERAIAATRKLPGGIDDVIADAAARRSDAFEVLPKLRAAGIEPDSRFMTQALWQRPILAVAAGARFVGARDAAAWRSLLTALRSSSVAMQPGVLAASLDSGSEEIRAASVWYLVHGYAEVPSKIDASVRAALAAPKETASDREAFGRELLRRMTGGAKKSDPRWLAWLQSPEADATIGSEITLFQYFTDDEFLTRKRHCDVASSDCRVPPRGKIPSTAVRQPDFQLPTVLPPGLADAVAAGLRCNHSWLATAGARADRVGRVLGVELQRLRIDNNCVTAVTRLMKLSLATPSSIAAPALSNGLVLVRGEKASPCLDEAPLRNEVPAPVRIGGLVTAPVVKRRVEPNFPASARRGMGGGTNVFVTVEAVIAYTGCVRSLTLLQQSPFPELNGAALEAISQWTFEPGRVNGQPVDVIFDLMINFKVGF